MTGAAHAHAIHLFEVERDRTGKVLLAVAEAFKALMLRERVSAASRGFRLDFCYLRAFDEEISRSVTGDIPLVVAAFVIIGVVVIETQRFRRAPHVSFATLTAWGMCAVGLSVLAGYGAVMWAGVPFTSLAQVGPFIFLGVGVDDVIVLLDSFRSARVTLRDGGDVRSRAEFAAERAGVSIAITSATNFLAFALGSRTVIPAVHWFCVYAAAAILADFIAQMSLFLAIVLIHETRDQAAGSPARAYARAARETVPLPPPADEAEARAIRDALRRVALAETTTTTPKKTTTTPETTTTTPVGTSEKEKKGSGALCGRWTRPPLDDWLTARGFSDRSGSRRRRARVLRLRRLRARARARRRGRFASHGARSRRFFSPGVLRHLRRDVRGAGWRGDAAPRPGRRSRVPRDAGVGARRVGDVPVQSLRRARGNVAGARRRERLHHWLTAALAAGDAANVTAPCGALGVPEETRAAAAEAKGGAEPRLVPAAAFASVVDATLAARPELASVVRRRNADGAVIASYFTTRAVAVADDYPLQLKIYRAAGAYDARASALLADAAPVEGFAAPRAFTYQENLVYWQQDAVLWDELLTNLTFAGAGVLIVCVFALAHPAALIAVAAVAVVDVFLFASLIVGRIRFNVISMINLVMAIGLAVDYTLHVCHAFLATPGMDRVARVKYALRTMGKSVLKGGGTTLIGTLPMAFSRSTIFRTFFALLFSTVIYGMTVGLVLIPVVSSLLPMPSAAHLQIEGRVALRDALNQMEAKIARRAEGGHVGRGGKDAEAEGGRT